MASDDPELKRRQEVEEELAQLSARERQERGWAIWSLLAVSLLFYLAVGFWSSGEAGAWTACFVIVIRLIILVPIGLLSCFVGAMILKTSFGTLGSASLKLTTLFVVSDAVASFAGLFSEDNLLTVLIYVLTLLISLWLLAWLFKLEPLEVFYFAIIMTVVRWGTLSLANQVFEWLNLTV